MKTLVVSRNIIVLIFAVMMLINGVQGISYGRDNAPTVIGETNTSIKVGFTDSLFEFDEKAYQIQLRRKSPQGEWITKCSTISLLIGPDKIHSLPGGNYIISASFTDLEPGVTYEARYRDTNLSECNNNPPSPKPWSAISEGTTWLENTLLAEFVDTSLALMVRRTLGLNTLDPFGILRIPKAELIKLTGLSANGSLLEDLRLPAITDLTGLEHATQLRTLRLSANNVSDITPLAGLTQLIQIDLWRNQISDITPLAGLTELRELDLGGGPTGNEIVDISPLAGLTELRELNLSSIGISDISPLAGLMELRELNLGFNRVSDISPLTQLIELTMLELHANQISDITPLAQLTELRELSLNSNEIVDISPLAQFKKLTLLYFSYNQVRDITPLAQAESLTKLYLDHNQIRDLSPLTTLTRLTTLDLASNQISDVTPLAQLSESLEDLDLRDNRIKDVTPLANLTYLERLSLRDNPITDTSALSPLLDEYPDLDVDIEVIREKGGPTLTVSSSPSLTGMTLHGGIVTLKLSSGAFDLRTKIKDAVTISGITNITFHWTDIEKVSDTEIRIILTYDGTINKDTMLTFTMGAGGIKNYNGPALTAEILVSADVGGTTTLNASTVAPLTEATLHGSVITLILSGKRYDTNWNYVSQNVTLSGIAGVTFKRHNVERVSDTRVTIPLEFNGNINTGSTLTFTVGAKAIENYDGPAFTAELPVSTGAEHEVPSTTPETPPETPADTDAVVSISPASVASPAVGGQLEVRLNIASGEAVAGYQATVQFDTTALRYVSGANGDYLPAGAFFVQPKVEGNLVKLNAASLAGESNGDGTLATLAFEVIAAKASALTLSDVILTDNEGIGYAPSVENAEITEPTGLKGDVNGDGIVNIQDLVLVAANLGKTGQNAADVNGDGQVNIQDLVLVAGALGNSAAAPSLHPQSLEMLTAADVKSWLSQAQHFNLTDAMAQKGILFLEQLLAVLTPKETGLLANYPNPFNPETWIPYQLDKPAEVTISIYAVDGQVVRRLALGHQPAGMYQNRSRAAYWDGRNEFGEPVASGIYFYTLTAGEFTATRKMLIRK